MNRLGNESSLYLRQHADNPVWWQPWDEAALNEAREKDLPILLSVGYSACHWCHVMAHESFEDDDTAGLMNRMFVNIKVDREERPDLDKIYQLAQQVLNGRAGGWPLTVFIDPRDHVPFFAGTYFPGEARYGMPAFRDVLQTVHDWFKKNRESMGPHNQKVAAALQEFQQPELQHGEEPLEDEARKIVRAAAQQIWSRHDAVNGGYGGAPKFPQAPTLQAAAVIGEAESGNNLHESLEFTLRQMARSGLRDHLDGGFFRYCVDGGWIIPHFEKMLYDNALLLPLYAEGARRWNSVELAAAARGMADWLESEMRQGDGGYAASIDADADGEEGGFHVWTPDQVRSVLDAEAAKEFCAVFGLDGPPNFESRAWHLQRARNDAGNDADPERLAASIRALQKAREKRVHPTLDEKRLTAWNALLAGGYARAGLALGETGWLDRAEDILEFIRKQLWTGDGLLAVYNRGQARFEAYLDDYACLLDALLATLRARWNPQWPRFAIAVAEAMLQRFEDPESGGFFFSDAAVDVPIARSMVFQDDATPAGNAVAVSALNRLGHLLGEPRYCAAAERCIRRALPVARQAPGGHAAMAVAMHELISPAPHVIVCGQDDAACRELKQWLDGFDRLDCYWLESPDESLPGMLRDYRSDTAVTAWLCRGTVCLPPVHTREELERLLA